MALLLHLVTLAIKGDTGYSFFSAGLQKYQLLNTYYVPGTVPTVLFL